MAPSSFKDSGSIAVIDIGSNSVRLVAYQSLERSLIPIWNEKMLCGLGRNLAVSGYLLPEAMDKAFSALKRFRVLCAMMKIKQSYILATAAAREAKNGKEFLKRATQITGQKIYLISGKREAHLGGLGVMASIYEPNGVVGDLGGGSLEFIDIQGTKIGRGVSLPLGGLVLKDRSESRLDLAADLVREALSECSLLSQLKGRSFYGVGGTWRALAKLHMSRQKYPFRLLHNYSLPAEEALSLVLSIQENKVQEENTSIPISAARWPLLTYGALILREIITMGEPKDIIISTRGMREGFLYERLKENQRAIDPLFQNASRLNSERSRDPSHGLLLCNWTKAFLESVSCAEEPHEKRLRQAACLLSDTGWQIDTEYQKDYIFTLVTEDIWVGLSHAERLYLALILLYRHGQKSLLTECLDQIPLSEIMIEQAKILGATLQIAFFISASIGGELKTTSLLGGKGKLTLTLPSSRRDLVNEKLMNRLKQAAALLKYEPQIRIGDDKQ